MDYHLDDTIVAVASAAGAGARGIVRLSGRRAVEIVAGCFRTGNGERLEGRAVPSIVPGELLLDNVRSLPTLLMLWPGHRSYTREPAAELHTFASGPLLARAVRTLCGRGARPAAAGEFTLRAFLAGRIDLTQAEAVLGVIDARASDELASALAQLAGGLARPLDRLRSSLLDLLAHLEAGLDFVEEEIEFVTPCRLEAELALVATDVDTLVAQLAGRSAAADEPQVVLVGWPNVGKSSLFNALVGQQRAITSRVAGTTRDYLSARLQLAGGGVCRIVDTAGVAAEANVVNRTGNDADDPIGHSAQEFARRQADQADLRLLCLDASRGPNGWEQAQLATLRAGHDLCVLTKCDQPLMLDAASQRWIVDSVATSAVNGAGLEELRRRLAFWVGSHAGEGRAVVSTAIRAADSLQRVAAGLAEARRLNAARAGDELIAGEIRQVLHDLGAVAGHVVSDDILERIFSRFCIGK